MSRRRAPEPRPDPRVEGGRYYCGYWAEEYDVLRIQHEQPVWGTLWTVRWAKDGRITTHATDWNWRRDRVIS